jgi:hypothetical protein
METLQSLLLRLEGGRTVCHELPSVQGVPLHFFHRVTEVLRIANTASSASHSSPC